MHFLLQTLDKRKRRFYNKDMAITKKFLKFSSNKIYYCHSTTTYAATISSQYRTVTQIHNECEIFILLKGAVRYVIEDESYQINEGEVVLIPPRTVHHTVVDTTKEYERIALEFPPDILPALPSIDLLSTFHQAKAHFYTFPADDVAHAEIAKQLLDFKRYCNSKDKYRDITLSQKIVSIVKNLHRLSGELIASGKILENKKKQTVSQICVDFIKKNIDKPITVQMIADETFISASHLLHQFKKEMDITLHQYIIFQKIQMADNLLSKGIAPLSVAKQLGFHYYSTFYNNYLKYCGHPPSEKGPGSIAPQKNVIE